MKKRIMCFLLCICSIFLFAGCSEKQEETKTNQIVIAQNDYAGAYGRASAIQNDVVNSMSYLESNNLAVQEGNPNDYWSDDNYYFLHFLPVYTAELEDLAVLNETDNFADVQAYILKVLVDKGYNESAISILKNDINQYTVKYESHFLHPEKKETIFGIREMNILYDATSNSFQVTSYILFYGEDYPIFDFFYEFAEIAPYTYIFQNNSERMYVRYQNNKIDYFAYSDLMINNEVITKENENEEVDSKSIENITETEERIYRYKIDQNSCFKQLKEIDKNWVTEANGNFEKLIIYTPQKTTITTTNVLTKEQSSFSIEAPSTSDK